MSANSRAVHRRQRIQWEWNIPLLVKSLILVGVVCIVGASLYFWQSSSMAAELLSQVKSAEDRGETKEKVKWLTRYVRLVPSDVENLAALAFAVDAQESGPNQNVEFARRRLEIALVACGDEPAYEDLKQRIRRKLIPRLLQFGTEAAPDVEKHIGSLGANPDDAEVIKWLANSLFLQNSVSQYQARDPEKYNKDDDYWDWLAFQPTGHVLQTAVDRNPDDVELAQKLIVACRFPGWFDPEKFTKEKLDELARTTTENLSNRNDGHAQFLAYYYTASSDIEKARSILGRAFSSAMDRLSRLAESKDVPSDYAPDWDWQIALEHSRSLDANESEKIYEQLIKLANERVSMRLREDAFVRIANLRMEKGKHEDAIAICQSALTSIKESSVLHRTIALANLRLERVEEAAKEVEKIEAVVELRLQQLEGEIGSRMMPSTRVAIREQVEVELWYARYLKGYLAVSKKDYATAVDELKECYKTPIAVAPEYRVESGLLLAACYSQSELWDLAGEIYDACSVLRPKDKSISIRAIKAWRQAGSLDRANEHLAGLDDGSFSTALWRAILLASKPASESEKRLVDEATKIARQRLEAVPVAEREPLEPWRLELLEIASASDGANLSDEQRKESLIKLEAVASKYPNIAELQSQVALDFATLGQPEFSSLAIGRLEQLAERTKATQDRANLALIKAKVLLAQNDIEGAVDFLKASIEAMPEYALAFVKLAAVVEAREDRIANAYSLISLVPEEKLDFQVALMLSGMLNRSNLSGAANAPIAEELANKLDRLINRFERSEDEHAKDDKAFDSENGVYWRYLAAERVLAKASNATDTKLLLEEASSYFKQIDVLRPSWGLASALGGRIASLKAQLEGQPKFSRDAIALWQRAIHDGDNRVSTVMDLVQELRKVNEFAQAEVELQRISRLADSVVPVSAVAVSLLANRGNFIEALKITEQLTKNKPEDVEGWLLRAQTAFSASRQVDVDEESRSKLRDEAWEFLEKSHSLSKGNNLAVWNARFRFKLLVGDKPQSVTEEMLKQSSLPEEVRLLEAGLQYYAGKELGQARNYLVKCELLNPNLPQVHVALADLYDAIGDTEETINYLRKAVRAAPKNETIRERLAAKLAFSSNKIDWQEIDGLLANDTRPTPRLTLVSALIDLNRGESERQADAEKRLRDFAVSPTPEKNDSKRILANFYAQQWLKNLKANQVELAIKKFEDAKRYYEELLNEVPVSLNDSAQYINLLLSFSGHAKKRQLAATEDYLPLVERAISRLESSTGSTILSLHLRIQLAKERGEDASINKIAQQWVDEALAGDLNSLGNLQLWEIVGQTLMKSGYAKESIAWLEKIYEKEPKKFEAYAKALTQDKRHDQAIAVCVKSYQAEPTAQAATLIAEVSMMRAEMDLPEGASKVLAEALSKFPDSAELLEAKGTLELLQKRWPEAVGYFERAREKQPHRRQTLNNLAIALSHMPMRQQDALALIQKTIEIYERDPDLLDTLGQIQYRNNHLQEALVTLTEACKRRDEDLSFKIHLAQVLIAQKNFDGAKEQWTKIKQGMSDDVFLTIDDKEALTTLNSHFGEKL